MEERFICKNIVPGLKAFNTKWQAPSNIALIKYWGKTPVQLPRNPSLSFTLSGSTTQTDVTFTLLQKPTLYVSFSILFEGKEMPDFRPKIQVFFERVLPYQPYLNHYDIVINSSNSFPHSSGIASSASSMAALSACLMDFESHLKPINETIKLQKTSFLSRLGSGSACRSINGPLMAWGKHSKLSSSSNLIAVPLNEVHSVFQSYCDTILIIDKGQKKVSSSLGHKLMHNHPYAENRFLRADSHFTKLLLTLKDGDLDSFISVVEKEALDLHAMMMTSNPYFILIQPKTLSVIHAIWKFRAESKIPLCFTLDAGANVHVLYPFSESKNVKNFIKNELLKFCEGKQCICDHVGTGIKKC